MKRTSAVAVIGLVLLSASNAFATYSYSYSKDMSASDWSTGWTISNMSKQTYSPGGYTGAGSTTYPSNTGQMFYSLVGGNVINMTVRWVGDSATFFQYLYAGTDGNGNYNLIPGYQIALGSNNASIYYHDYSGTSSLLGSAAASLHDNMTVRSVVNNGMVGVFVDNVLVLSVSTPSNPPTSGGTGFGIFAGAGDLVTHVDIGSADTTGPTAISSSSIGKSPFTNHIDLQWPASSDPNGLGIAEYCILRFGQQVGTTTTLSYSDATVVPSSTYSYTLRVLDDFLNIKDTNFTVSSQAVLTNPPYPSATPEGRRVGVRPTGAYWGASGENIDILSGNLSFALPLFAAQGRAGMKVGFGLAYNSQNWRQDSGGNWKFDGDVGYGFGWRLLAGAIVPVWNPGGMSAAYYIFTDSTGAEYRLDQNNSNVWSSKESVYVYFDASANTLHFRGGTFWYMGSVSASTEADAGVMYPTVMQDINTNQIRINYLQAPGASWTNSSARISTISDVRTQPCSSQNPQICTGANPPLSYNPTYNFTYNNDTPRHLTSISNMILSGENFTLTYLTNQALSAPFNGQSFGSTAFLSTAAVIDGTLTFTYNGSGEATHVALPHGGYLGYDYRTTTYSSGRSYREVIRRYLSKDGSTQTTYPFSHEGSPGPDVHQFTILDDPGGVGEKYWTFSTSGVNEGLVTQYQGRQLPGPVNKTESDFFWWQDAVGNSYISCVVKTLDPGPYQAQSVVTQTVDSYGNVTQVNDYNYGNGNTPARTYNYSYSTASGYTSKYLYNLLTQATVTDGTSTATLGTNTYNTVGNLASSATPTSSGSYSYDGVGNMTSMTVNGVTVTKNFSNATNYAAPSQLSVGSLSETLSYNSFLGLTNDTGPNGDSTSMTWLSAGRPSSTTSPFGATTSTSYSGAAMLSQTVSHPNQDGTGGDGRWTRNTLDGLGRPVLTESGTKNGTTLSQAEIVYDSCGCSPLGKLKKNALPHAVGATPVWTIYTYDGIGRTVSVQLPDGASTSTNFYQGNTVTVTDPAGKWKKFITDALGNLTQVIEPDPANPTTATYVTNYTYDLLNHLIQVSMPRPTGTQTRTFNYNNGGFLLSATNPENGTVTYTYNSSNKVATKTDAKNQRMVYTYDSTGRLTQVQRGTVANGQFTEDTNQRTTYYYDSNPFDGSYSAYVSGRLAAVQYSGGCNSSCDTIQEMYSYSAAGGMVVSACG